MKRIKKLILIFITIGVATLIPITKTHASSGTAGTKGFTISNMIYHHDAQAGYLNLDTDDNNYGKINLWSAVYVTRTPENSMIILVLWEAEIESNKTSSAIKRFVNKEMNIVVSSNIPGVVVDSHYPNEDNYVKGKTISWSVESGASSGYMHSVASYSESDFVPEIRLISTTKGSNEVEKNFFFENYYKNDRTDKAPYRGNYKQKGMLTYEVDNYSNISFANTYIKIDYSGTIFKDHWWKNVDYNGSRSIKFDYDYGLGKFQKK